MYKNFDVIIVGSGLFGATCSYELSKSGYKCLVIEKRNHIGGNCYTESKDGINIHKYGPHIFHTSNKKIWDWVNKFAKFNHYRHRVKVNYKNSLYSFPINLESFYQLWQTKTPEEAIQRLKNVKVTTTNPNSLEGWVLSQVGHEIYERFIQGYTTKQWGKNPAELPASIIKRIPLRYTYNDFYFDDPYQGIPIGGYTPILEKLLASSKIILNTDFFEVKKQWNLSAKTVIYTGPIDRFFNYQFGELDYRSLQFESQRLAIPDYQGIAIVNYTSSDVPYTRIVEHKHFEFGRQDVTWVTREYPQKYSKGLEPYYPIRDEKNKNIYQKYKELSQSSIYKNYIFGGRLAEYQYYDMHQVIGSALKTVEKIKNSTYNG